MAKKPKCDSCTKGWCQNHVFEMVPKRSNLFLKKTFKIRLCPLFNKNSNRFQKSIPVINNDIVCHAPLFLLEDQMEFYQLNGEKAMINHLENLNKNQSGTSLILIPKHGRNQNYCTVCEEYYQDYLSHTEEFDHKRNVNGNRCTSYMREMECRYKKLRKKQLSAKTVEIKNACEETN